MVTLALHPVFLLAVPFAAAAFAVAWLLPRRHLKDAGWRAADAGPEDETTPVQPVP
jgi:hypothetical protein